jgi:hypothetical protein
MTIFGNDDMIDSQYKTRHIRLDYLIPSRQRRLWGSVPTKHLSLQNPEGLYKGPSKLDTPQECHPLCYV